MNAEDSLNPESARTSVLVPPYPILGPEPMERQDWQAVAWALAGGLVAVLIGTALLIRSRRRSATRTKQPDPSVTEAERQSAGVTARERVVELSESVREALVARFGESWRAKTTEEIASEPSLADTLGVPLAEHLIDFLQVADLVKFAADRLPGYLPKLEPDLQRAEAEAGAWLEALAAEGSAGANSTINGEWSETRVGPRRRSTTARSSETKA
jgi:hypothetical protein